MPCFVREHHFRDKVDLTKRQLNRFVKRLVSPLKLNSWTKPKSAADCKSRGHCLKLVNVTDHPHAASEEDLSWTRKLSRPSQLRQTKSAIVVPTRKKQIEARDSTDRLVAANIRPEVELRCEGCGRRAQNLGWAVSRPVVRTNKATKEKATWVNLRKQGHQGEKYVVRPSAKGSKKQAKREAVATIKTMTPVHSTVRLRPMP